MDNLGNYLLLIATFISGQCFSQNQQAEINTQIWKPQLEAMQTNQADKFISVMSKDVVQVSYDRKVIRNYDEFSKEVISVYNRLKERKLSRNMAFRFLERIAKDGHAFEDGFYKYELVDDKAEKRVFYGYFQVVLRKENDAWKVLVDYNSDNYNGKPVTAEQFDKAKTLDSLEN